MSLFNDFLPVIGIFIAGVCFIAIMMFMSYFSRPRQKQSDLKLATYECGEEAYSDRIGFQFNYQYFIYAIVFAILDILAVFLFSWALTEKRFDEFIIPTAVFTTSLI